MIEHNVTGSTGARPRAAMPAGLSTSTTTPSGTTSCLLWSGLQHREDEQDRRRAVAGTRAAAAASVDPHSAAVRSRHVRGRLRVHDLPEASAFSAINFGRILNASSSYLPRKDLAEPPKRRTSGRKSLRCASRTSPYTTSTKRLPAKGRGSALLPSPLSSQRKVSPGCRAGPMGIAPGDLALRRPRSQICDSWISRHGASALSSVACFSFYLLWCRLVSTRSSAAPAYPARR